MKRLTWRIAFVVALAIIGAACCFMFLRKTPVLTAATWSGPYGRAQASALFLPYGQKAGINIRIAQYDGGIDRLRQQVVRKQYDWDVIDLELPDAIAACREGLLEPIDMAHLPRGSNGQSANADFVPNALGRCWVGSVVYSQLIVYAPERYGSAKPTAVSDFFDLVRFPGQRALRGASPKLNLELALLADGIAPKNIYPMLSTEQGVARALAKLDSIRSSIVWWNQSSETVAMIAEGRAAFATVLNGDVFNAAMHGENLGVIWNRQLYELDVFGIPKDDPKRAMAMDFVSFATSALSLAAVAEWVPYGPARRSAVDLIGKHPELKVAMRPFSPTAPEHFNAAFAVDDAWWEAHGAELSARWKTWLDQ